MQQDSPKYKYTREFLKAFELWPFVNPGGEEKEKDKD